jgi:hypothetical protein
MCCVSYTGTDCATYRQCDLDIYFPFSATGDFSNESMWLPISFEPSPNTAAHVAGTAYVNSVVTVGAVEVTGKLVISADFIIDNTLCGTCHAIFCLFVSHF